MVLRILVLGGSIVLRKHGEKNTLTVGKSQMLGSDKTVICSICEGEMWQINDTMLHMYCSGAQSSKVL